MILELVVIDMTKTSKPSAYTGFFIGGLEGWQVRRAQACPGVLRQSSQWGPGVEPLMVQEGIGPSITP